MVWRTADGFVAVPGIGRHEVIIESPHHLADLARMAPLEVRGVLEAYRARYRALRFETEGVLGRADEGPPCTSARCDRLGVRQRGLAYRRPIEWDQNVLEHDRTHLLR
jgi:hypothetical protein